MQSSCQMAQFSKTKNRPKSCQFFTKCLISVKITILILHIIPPPQHAVGECLVDIRFAETCKRDFVYISKIFICLTPVPVSFHHLQIIDDMSTS